MTQQALTQCIKGGDRNGRSGWLIAFSYDEDVVETIKTKIPHTFREWRPEQKVWWVAEEYSAVLEAEFKNFHALAYLQGRLAL